MRNYKTVSGKDLYFYLTHMDKDQKNFKYCTEALQIKNQLEKNYMRLAEYAYNIKNDNLFLPQWSSWSEFIADLKISENQANKLVQIYYTFIITFGIDEETITTAGGWSVIAELLPVINSIDDANRWLESARELTREDLRKEVKEAKSGVQMKSCGHKNTYVIRICRDCGHREEIHHE